MAMPLTPPNGLECAVCPPSQRYDVHWNLALRQPLASGHQQLSGVRVIRQDLVVFTCAPSQLWGKSSGCTNLPRTCTGLKRLVRAQ